MKTYVIIDVTYDYYRFQENIGIAHSLEDAWTFACQKRENVGCENYPIFDTKKGSLKCDKPEIPHIYIEEWS